MKVFKGESDTKRRAKISASNSKKTPKNIFIIKSQSSVMRDTNPGGYQLNWKTKISPNVKTYRSFELEKLQSEGEVKHFLFLGGGVGGGVKGNIYHDET